MMRIRKTFASKMADGTDYPKCSFSGYPVITLEGNERLDIEGCKNIIEISELKLKIDMGFYAITVVGDDMTLQSVTGDSMTILGKFQSINIEEAML